MRITGTREIQRLLARLPEALKNSAESTVLREGAKPVLKSAKSKVPVGLSGQLKKSMGVTVKKVRGFRSARVGPRNGFEKTIVVTNPDGTQSTKKVNPSKYSHIVELGSSRSAAKPFIRPAVEDSKNEALAGMATGFQRFLTRTITRLRNRR